MKKLSVVFAVLLASASFAQNCKEYYLLQNNKTIEMSLTNKKGKPAGRQVYTVSNLSTTDGAVSANVKTEMFDDNNKLIGSGNNNIKCNGGVMLMDMKMALPRQQQEQAIQTADVKAESVFLEFPTSMNVGEDLKDGSFSMNMDMNGMQQQLIMTVNNRKVEAKEKITTPAGSWDCFKISYKTKITIKTMGIGIPVNMTCTDWFAPGFGIVKTQSNYGGTEITSIK